MTIAFNVQSDIKSATIFLDRLGKRQIPFATSLALNKTAVEVKEKEQLTMRRDLDNPTPTTVKAIRVKRSTKRNLTAIIFILPAVARFLNYQIDGGTRPPRGRTEAVPVSIRLNQYGNIIGRRQGKIAKLLARVDTFSGRVRGIPGIWQRQKSSGRLKLLVAYENKTRYRIRWRFYAIANREAIKTWPAAFRRSLQTAIATIR